MNSAADTFGFPRLVTIDASQSGQRLDSILALVLPQFSRSHLQRAIDGGHVTVDGGPARAAQRLRVGQHVCVQSVPDSESGPRPEPMPLKIVFEDAHLLVVDKPPGMVVHPAKGHWSGTLVSGLAHHCQSLSSLGGPTRPGIVHRLDRDTSGVLIVAKTDASHAALARQFQQRQIVKTYLAIVRGMPDRDCDRIDLPIGVHPYHRERMAIRANHPTSRPAITDYQVDERLMGYARLRVQPHTGRTHQIRLHLAHLGCPVVADRLYGGHAVLLRRDLGEEGNEVLIDRQALHAQGLQLRHPVSGECICFEAPVPDDMQRLLIALRQRAAV